MVTDDFIFLQTIKNYRTRNISSRTNSVFESLVCIFWYAAISLYDCYIICHLSGINKNWCCNKWPWQAHRPKYSLHVDKLNISVRCIKVDWFHTPICYKVGTSQNNWLYHTIQRDKFQYFVFFKYPINCDLKKLLCISSFSHSYAKLSILK